MGDAVFLLCQPRVCLGLDSSARGMLGFPFSPLLSSSEQAVNIAAPIARMNNDRYDFFIRKLLSSYIAVEHMFYTKFIFT